MDDCLIKPFEFEELEVRILENVIHFSRTQTMQQSIKQDQMF